MENNKPSPEEIISAQQKHFNAHIAAAIKYKDNVHAYLLALNKLTEVIYTDAYTAGYEVGQTIKENVPN